MAWVPTLTLAYWPDSMQGGEPMIDTNLTRLCMDEISARRWRQWLLEQGTPPVRDEDHHDD